MTGVSHTPGPWRWEVNRAHKSVKLCGGPPKRGFGRYDLTVMDFRRFGMAGAAPEFWFWDFDKFVGKPMRADELAIAVEGREHHANWFAGIDHPDAHLIAAAPDLLAALEAAEQHIIIMLSAIAAVMQGLANGLRTKTRLLPSSAPPLPKRAGWRDEDCRP